MGSSSQGAGFGTYMPNPLPPAPSGEVPWAQGYESGGTGAGFNYTGVPKLLPGPGQLYGLGAGGVAPPPFSSSPSMNVAPAAVSGSTTQAGTNPYSSGTSMSPAEWQATGIGGLTGGGSVNLLDFYASGMGGPIVNGQRVDYLTPDTLAWLAANGMSPTGTGGNTYGTTYTTPPSTL